MNTENTIHGQEAQIEYKGWGRKPTIDYKGEEKVSYRLQGGRKKPAIGYGRGGEGERKPAIDYKGGKESQL